MHTLDLVVLAVEWGSGRRQGWLSNIHLGARDPATGGFVMLGKTFKGMTDEMLAWQTERFTELATAPRRPAYVVHVRPEQVVEIAFDGVQRSTRYPGGVALRFARVLRYRDDKTADEADTIETVRGHLGLTGHHASLGKEPPPMDMRLELVPLPTDATSTAARSSTSTRWDSTSTTTSSPATGCGSCS